ncbi:hypothetical protein HQ533_03150 [Candidatus Woesearchaeota archaeon]|nr:hypothetical protein [Candidatus Woesearchaeota archaeon]
MYYDHIDKILEITGKCKENELDEIIEFVGTNGIRSSREKRYIWSDTFAKCNGIIFVPEYSGPSTLAHISELISPWDMFVNDHRIENITNRSLKEEIDINQLYVDKDSIQIMNIYDPDYFAAHPSRIEEALNHLGFQNIQHKQVEPESNEEVRRRDLFLDSEKKLLYMFKDGYEEPKVIPISNNS